MKGDRGVCTWVAKKVITNVEARGRNLNKSEYERDLLDVSVQMRSTLGKDSARAE